MNIKNNATNDNYGVAVPFVAFISYNNILIIILNLEAYY